MGKSHVSLDLKFKETSNTAYEFGTNVADCSEVGRELVTV